MDESADKNMIDKDEYPQTAAIEERCVHMLADSPGTRPKPVTSIGCSTTGSSEAAMLGGLALKWNWRKRQHARGKSTASPTLITGPVQVAQACTSSAFHFRRRESAKSRWKATACC